MRFQTIPKTDLYVSSICLGSTGIGSTIDLDASFRLLDLFVERGGNFIDTAAVYANWLPGERNVSERTIGRWMAQRGNQKRVIVATKGAHPELETMHIPRISRREIESDLTDSLRNLGVEAIDLYYLHRDDPSQPVESILAILADQVKAGKIRYFGCSNWRADRIRAAQQAASKMGITGFVADQMRWSLAATDAAGVGDTTTVTMNRNLFNFHQESGMAAVAFSSQAGGLFQKLVAGKQFNEGSYPALANRKRLAGIQALSAETGLTISQIVLGYLLSQPFATIPVIGSRTPAQLTDSLSSADVTLSAEQVGFLTREI